jgi:hypothetical protein
MKASAQKMSGASWKIKVGALLLLLLFVSMRVLLLLLASTH